MIRASSFLVLLIVFSAGLFLLHNTSEVFSLDTASQFDNLVNCSDTQMAQTCWKKFGEAILSSARFSDLAYQIAEVCLQKAESQHLHDIQFLLNVQKCFHLADSIDLRTKFPSAPSKTSKEIVSHTWLLLTQTLILIYLVLSVSDRTFMRAWGAVTLGWEFFESLPSIIINFLRKDLSFQALKALWRHSSTDEEILLATVSHEAKFLEQSLGANCSSGAKATPGSASVENHGHQARVPNTFKKPDNAEGRGKRRRKLPYQTACEVSDYESHNACGQDSDDYTDTIAEEIAGKSRTFYPPSSNAKSIEKHISTIIPIQREIFKNRVTVSRESRVISGQKKLGAHSISSTNDGEKSNLSSKRIMSDGQKSKDFFTKSIDENKYFNVEAKPSFDISTESGRAEMKAFIRAKMSCNTQAPSRSRIENYRSLSRLDADNQKMRRVFVANKGWIWLSKLESNGVQFVSNGAKRGPYSRQSSCDVES